MTRRYFLALTLAVPMSTLRCRRPTGRRASHVSAGPRQGPIHTVNASTRLHMKQRLARQFSALPARRCPRRWPQGRQGFSIREYAGIGRVIVSSLGIAIHSTLRPRRTDPFGLGKRTGGAAFAGAVADHCSAPGRSPRRFAPARQADGRPCIMAFR
jgi:hypothetical protein